jgi:hypothetical protein
MEEISCGSFSLTAPQVGGLLRASTVAHSGFGHFRGREPMNESAGKVKRSLSRGNGNVHGFAFVRRPVPVELIGPQEVVHLAKNVHRLNFGIGSQSQLESVGVL